MFNKRLTSQKVISKVGHISHTVGQGKHAQLVIYHNQIIYWSVLVGVLDGFVYYRTCAETFAADCKLVVELCDPSLSEQLVWIGAERELAMQPYWGLKTMSAARHRNKMMHGCPLIERLIVQLPGPSACQSVEGPPCIAAHRCASVTEKYCKELWVPLRWGSATWVQSIYSETEPFWHWKRVHLKLEPDTWNFHHIKQAFFKKRLLKSWHFVAIPRLMSSKLH